MVVQHNLMALNSNRMLGVTTSTQAKTTEKLSSGYRINRAADDAAGLAISEKMRKQMRGLSQASMNAQDGISSVQTAEGALNEVHDMLQRMNELAVKAANGTNSESDRQAIQDEVDQLVTEIDRVSTTTKFNETYLLKGVSKNGNNGELTYDIAKDAVDANQKKLFGSGFNETTGAEEYSLVAGTDETISPNTKCTVKELEVTDFKYIIVETTEKTTPTDTNEALTVPAAVNALNAANSSSASTQKYVASLEEAMKDIRNR